MKSEDKEKYKIEEYRITKERLNKIEERRYQLLVLCITAFGVIFGFSDKISEPLVPIALLTVLTICVILHRGQTNRQNFTRAYIINYFESKINKLDYEGMLKEVAKSYSFLEWRFFKKTGHLIYIITNPFSFLLLVTILSCIYYGNSYYSYNMLVIKDWEIIIYLTFNILGYIITIINIYYSSILRVSYFSEKMRKK